MKNEIENSAGLVLSVNNRRFFVDKQSEANLQLTVAGHFTGNTIPSDARFVIQSQTAGFLIIEGSGSGFVAGECIRDALKLEDALFVEPIDDQLLVVLCRNGVVQGDYLTGRNLDDALSGDLFGLDTPIDVISVHGLPESIKTMVPDQMLGSLRVIDESVLDSLSPSATLELQSFRSAVRRSGIYTGEMYGKIGFSIGLAILLAVMFWPDSKPTQVDPVIQERHRLQEEFAQLRFAPTPAEAGYALSEALVALEDTASWGMREIIITKEGQMQVLLGPRLSNVNPDARAATSWARRNGFRLKWRGSDEVVALRTWNANRDSSQLPDLPLNTAQNAVVSRFDGFPGVKIGLEDPISMEVYHQQELRLGLQNVSADTLLQGLRLMSGLPVILKQINVRYDGFWYQVEAQFTLVTR